MKKWLSYLKDSAGMIGIVFIFLMALMSTALLLAFATVMAVKDRIYCGVETQAARSGCRLPDDDSLMEKRIKRYDDIVLNDLRNYSANVHYDLQNYMPAVNMSYMSFNDELANITNDVLEYTMPDLSLLRVVTDKRNFTDAAEFCRKFSGNGEILTLRTKDDHKYIYKYLNQNDDSFEDCERFLIGYRSRIMELFLSPSGKVTYPSSEVSFQITNVYLLNNNNCAMLSPQNNFKIRSVPCNQKSTCFVCDLQDCGNSSLPCQEYVNILWPPLDFVSANGYCRDNFPKSTGLVLFTNDELTPLYKSVFMNVANKHLCVNHEYMALKARLSKIYETFHGVPVRFNSQIIHVNNYRDHCLVIDKSRNYSWTSESCMRENCFICRMNPTRLKRNP